MNANIPGVSVPQEMIDELRAAGDNRYEVELGVTVAALSGDFKGTVSLHDLVPPQSYTLAVEGAGRPGFVKGQARVTPEGAGDRTPVTIAAQADAAQRVRDGNHKAIGALVGAVMKASRGQANPALVNELLRARLVDGAASASGRA